MIAARSLTVRVGARALVRDVTLDVAPGEVVALVGPNGAGKSTLLRCLAGERAPSEGLATLDDRPLSLWDPAALARRRAVLAQRNAAPEGYTALGVALLGRTPHGDQGAPHGRARAWAALERVGLRARAHEEVTRLSGGELQRVHVARVLAQLDGAAEGARFLLLDEPATHLDVAQQDAVLGLARALARDEGVGVLAVLHELPLAARHADRACVLHEGRVAAEGDVREALTAATLARVWGVPFEVLERAGRPYPIALPTP